MRRKAGTAVGILGLAQGFVALAVAFLPAEPNPTLVKWLLFSAAVFVVVGLAVFFWPSGREQVTQTATQSGSRNVQIQGQTVYFEGSISTGEDEVPAGQLPDGRTLVDVTPEYLVGFFEEHTSIQAERLTEAFLGKWMRLSASVEDVAALGAHKARIDVPTEGGSPVIILIVNNQATVEHRVRILKKGDPITVVGQIYEVDSASVTLTNCELE